ncbi:hypothetical protein AURDEDRAFT_121345 [Auricularia subglabra TFB-10046 SS5]|nr:hypothetical protein AURDEDRAFT_121345 [Auricularia subglabra TFB-10046 SS5]
MGIHFGNAASGVRVHGSPVIPGPRTTVVVVLDGNHEAAQTVEVPSAGTTAVIVQYEKLDPSIQHSLYLDLTNPVVSLAGLQEFEVLQTHDATNLSPPTGGGGPEVESTGGDGPQSSHGLGVASAPLSTASFTAQTPGITPKPGLVHATPPRQIIPAVIAAVVALFLLLAAVIIVRRLRKVAAGSGDCAAAVRFESGHGGSKLQVALAPQRAGKLRVFNLWAKRAASPEPLHAASEGDDADAVLAFAASLRNTMRRMGVPVEGLRAALPRVIQDMEEQETLPDYDG